MLGRLRAFRLGLKEMNYVEGENVAVLYRFASIDRLPELAAELVHHRVAVIVSSAGPAAFAAKAATATIPIVFLVGEDPVKLGLVSSLAWPSGNLTGINLFTAELAAKRLEILRELVPQVARVAVLVNPADVTTTESALKDAEAAARAMGLQVHVVNANTSREIDTAFETIARQGTNAVFVSSSPFFIGRRVQLVQLAALNRLPTTYSLRDFAEIGGLMSYGPHIGEAYRQIGVLFVVGGPADLLSRANPLPQLTGRVRPDLTRGAAMRLSHQGGCWLAMTDQHDWAEGNREAS